MTARNKRRRGGGRQPRRIVVRGVRHEQPDVRKLSRALIALAQAQAEKDAQAEHERTQADHPSDASGASDGR